MYIIDTREQKPLPLTPAKRKKLEVGDYTTHQLEGIFHIERKSLMDLYQTLTASNPRFKYELFRAAYYNIELVVVVEGTYDDFINKRFPKGDERKFSSDGLAKLIKTFQSKYFLVFHFCDNRKAAKTLVMSLLAGRQKRPLKKLK